MRNQKINAAVFTVLLVLFVGATKYIERRNANRPLMEGDLLFPDFNPDAVRRITIIRPADLTGSGKEELIELVRNPKNLDKWSMASPYQGRAAAALGVNSFLTTTFLGHIESARAREIVEAMSPDERRKVDKTAIKVRIHLESGDGYLFSLSNRTGGTGEFLYLRFPAADRYLLVPVNPFGSFMLPAHAYLEHRAFPFGIEKVDSIRIWSFSEEDAFEQLMTSIYRYKDKSDKTVGWMIQDIAGTNRKTREPMPLKHVPAQKLIQGTLLQSMVFSRRFSEKPNPWTSGGKAGGNSIKFAGEELPDVAHLVDISVDDGNPDTEPVRYFLRFPNDDASSKIMLAVRVPAALSVPKSNPKTAVSKPILERLANSDLEVMEIPFKTVKRLLDETHRALNNARVAHAPASRAALGEPAITEE